MSPSEDFADGPGSRDLGPFFFGLYGIGLGVFAFFLIRNIAWHLRFEDAYIVLRYARNLIDGHGFVFNPGEPVLGVTTPLHTLVTTVYVALGGELAPALQNIAGVLALLLEATLVLLLARRLGHPIAGFFAAAITLMNLHLSYLYLGMEVHLFAALVLLCFLLLIDEAPQAKLGFVLGLAFLTRYDAALLAGLIGFFFWGRDRRFPLRLLGGFCVPVLPWIVFAMAYFGTLVPSTLSAKEGYEAVGEYLVRVFFEQKADVKRLIGLFLPIEPLKAGLSYLWPVPFLFATVVLARRDAKLALLGIYPLLHVVAYALIGSDPGFTWHYYLLHPFVALLGTLGIALVGNSLPRKARTVASVAAGGILLVLLVDLARGVSQQHQMDPHTRQLHEMGAWLQENSAPGTKFLQPSIGVLGWTSGLPMVDHAGLVTPGLFYFDDHDCTPLDEVLDLHAPDAALLTRSTLVERPDFLAALEERGFERRRVFTEPVVYELWSLP